MLKTATFFLGATLSFSAAAADLESYTDRAYDLLRTELIEAGYTPDTRDESSDCFANREMRQCLIYPETQSCAGTGTAPCKFQWYRDNAVVIVFTHGERPIVVEVSQQ